MAILDANELCNIINEKRKMRKVNKKGDSSEFLILQKQTLGGAVI